MSQYQSAICRIARFFENGEIDIVGAGFLVSDRHVLTCAHVVNAVLDLAEESQARPQGEVSVQFFSEDENRPLGCKIVYWLPMDNRERKEDIAVLQLSRRVNSIQPVAMGALADLEPGAVLEAYGFTATGLQSGGQAKCNLQSYSLNSVDGWGQLENGTGYPISKGFSGTLLWAAEQQQVAGMVVAAEYRKKDSDPNRGFMIRASVLSQIVALVTLFARIAEQAYAIQKPLDAAAQFCRPDCALSHRTSADLAARRVEIEQLAAGDSEIVVRFAAHLIESLSQSHQDLSLDLRAWASQYYSRQEQQDLDRLRGVARQEIATAQAAAQLAQSTAVMVVIEERTAELQKLFGVQAFSISNCDRYSPDRSDGCRNILLYESDALDRAYCWEELPGLLARCIETAQAEHGLLNPRIEIFLPLSRLNESVAFWPVFEDPDDEEDIDYLGIQHEVRKRSPDRLQKKYLSKRPQWKALWEKTVIAAKDRPAEQSFFRCTDNSIVAIKAELSRQQYGGLCLTRSPQGKKPFNALIRNGVPLGLWVERDLDHVDCQAEMERLLAGTLEALPERVRELRRQAYVAGIDPAAALDQTCIGQHLSLLWDDPRLIPPESTSNLLGMAES